VKAIFDAAVTGQSGLHPNTTILVREQSCNYAKHANETDPLSSKLIIDRKKKKKKTPISRDAI